MDKIVVADAATDIRRGIDFIGVTINFLIHDGKGNFLLQKRSQNCRDEQGKWDIGGGALEFGEKLEDAVRREVDEELGATIKIIEFLRAYEAHRNNEGTPTHWMAFTHAVEIERGSEQINEPHKIDEIGWFNSGTLPSPLHSQFHESFDYALSKNIVK